MTKPHETLTNGDTVSIKLGGDFVRKTLPWILIGGGALGGGGGIWAFKAQHDSEIKALQEGQARVEAKVDTIIALMRRGR